MLHLNLKIIDSLSAKYHNLFDPTGIPLVSWELMLRKVPTFAAAHLEILGFPMGGAY